MEIKYVSKVFLNLINLHFIFNLFEELKENLLKNDVLTPTFLEKHNLQIEELIWSLDQDNHSRKYDLIILADCLFFKDFHSELIATLLNLLRNSESSIIMIVPERGDSLQKFIGLASDSFVISFISPDKEMNSALENLKANPNYKKETDFLFIIEMRKIK